MIPFPDLDPVALRVGPLAVRWYGIAYVAGFLTAWRVLTLRPVAERAGLDRDTADRLLVWLVLGVLLGGRLGYVLFYKAAYYAAHPLEVFAVWAGGMSFHGGLLGVAVAALGFSARHRLDLRKVGDALALATPAGLCFGRLANFVNGELYGRVTGVPWGMVFPGGGPNPRHPSQLYEAGLEGPVLGLLVWLAWRRSRRAGSALCALLLGYAVLRFLVEFTREPDAHLGILWGGLSMGQWLSLGMAATGALVWVWMRRAAPSADH